VETGKDLLVEPPGTAPGSSPLITCAFIVISGKPAKDIWACEVKVAITKRIWLGSRVRSVQKPPHLMDMLCSDSATYCAFAGMGMQNFGRDGDSYRNTAQKPTPTLHPQEVRVRR